MVVHTFDALKSRNFSIYMAGQSVALTGMWVQKLATSWLVYRITESPFLLGLVELLSNAPIFIVGLIAGAWLEKHDIRKLIIATQTLTLIHALVMSILLFTNIMQMWHILFLSFYLGVVFAIDMPARQAWRSTRTGRPHAGETCCRICPEPWTRCLTTASSRRSLWGSNGSKACSCH